MAKTRTGLTIAAALLAWGLAGTGHAWALGECRKFGSPSFTADRTVSIGGHVIQSKVAVAGGKEREEFEADGHRQVRLVSPGRIVTYDPDARTGTMRSVPKPALPPKGSLRIDVAPEGDNKVVTLTIRNKAGAWEQLARTTCRSDGVPLAQSFTAPVNGAKTEGTMTLSNVSLGPVAPAQFEVPAGIRMAR
jgi:hypothetical protein